MKSFEIQSSYFVEWPLHLGTFNVTGKLQALACPSQCIPSGGTWWLCPITGAISSNHLVKVVFSILLQNKGTMFFFFHGEWPFHGEAFWAHIIIQLLIKFISFSNHLHQGDPHLNQLLTQWLTNSNVFNSTVILSGFMSPISLRSYF